MEELTLLIEMVSKLPTMAIWVLIGFFIYKVVFVGSIFGIVRLAIIKTHDFMIKIKDRVTIHKINSTDKLKQILITGQLDLLLHQLNRLVGMTTNCKSDYIHKGDINWLKEAIDEKLTNQQGEDDE